MPDTQEPWEFFGRPKQAWAEYSVNVSVIILTYNEERNLPGCLASLAGLEGTVFVVDSGSTDRTLELAAAANCVVAHNPFTNYGDQRNWSQRNLPIDSEWVLHLDADERLTPELVREIRALGEHPSADGFLLKKQTMFMGRWMRHGGHYPSYHLRLFRRAKGRCEQRLYDQHFLVDGTIRQLRHDYIDVVASNLDIWTMRHLRWAASEAREMLTPPDTTNQVRASLTGGPIQRKRWLRQGLYGRAPLFLRSFLYFGYRYFGRLGFLDGIEGLIFHFLQGCWFRFMIDCKLYEASTEPNRLALKND